MYFRPKMAIKEIGDLIPSEVAAKAREHVGQADLALTPANPEKLPRPAERRSREMFQYVVIVREVLAVTHSAFAQGFLPL